MSSLPGRHSRVSGCAKKPQNMMTFLVALPLSDSTCNSVKDMSSHGKWNFTEGTELLGNSSGPLHMSLIFPSMSQVRSLFEVWERGPAMDLHLQLLHWSFLGHDYGQCVCSWRGKLIPRLDDATYRCAILMDMSQDHYCLAITLSSLSQVNLVSIHYNMNSQAS